MLCQLPLKLGSRHGPCCSDTLGGDFGLEVGQCGEASPARSLRSAEVGGRDPRIWEHAAGWRHTDGRGPGVPGIASTVKSCCCLSLFTLEGSQGSSENSQSRFPPSSQQKQICSGPSDHQVLGYRWGSHHSCGSHSRTGHSLQRVVVSSSQHPCPCKALRFFTVSSPPLGAGGDRFKLFRPIYWGLSAGTSPGLLHHKGKTLGR